LDVDIIIPKKISSKKLIEIAIASPLKKYMISGLKFSSGHSSYNCNKKEESSFVSSDIQSSKENTEDRKISTEEDKLNPERWKH
jgi:hypothetical protein